MTRYARSAILSAVIASSAVLAAFASDSPAVTGDVQQYQVMSGDTLGLVAARFGLEPAVLARDNGLAAGARLKPGDTLEVDNRHIVPTGFSDGIVVNLPQRRLFLFRGGSLKHSYPVAVGSGGWRTPVGEFSVKEMEMDPSWEVPKSIQAEMAREGKRVLTRVAPGPENPLGTRWIGLTDSIGIHGTNAPSSIFKYATHGCIRMSIEDVEHLFDQVAKGDRAVVIYEPLLVANDGGEVFVEVHRDPYSRGGASLADLTRKLAALGVEAAASTPEAAAAIKLREGRAISLRERAESAGASARR
jgi:L,D-transpeptidase ErfK/SrfK